MWFEGGALVGGIAISAIANTGADCDEMEMPGPNVDNDCRQTAKILSTVGVTLILAGLLGFIVTVSTAEEEERKAVEVETTKPDDDEKSKVKLPPGVNPQPQPAPGAPGSEPAPAPDTGSAPATPQR